MIFDIFNILYVGKIPQFLPLDEATASRAVFIIISTSVRQTDENAFGVGMHRIRPDLDKESS